MTCGCGGWLSSGIIVKDWIECVGLVCNRCGYVQPIQRFEKSGEGKGMTFREAMEKLKSISGGERVVISYSAGADDVGENYSIYMHRGGKCVIVQSYEAGFVELAKSGHVEDQEPEGAHGTDAEA
jgi:hypothetical protein